MKKLITVLMCLSFILTPVVPAQASGGGDKSSGFYMNQILSIASGVLGSTIITNCTLSASTPSLMVYMAGSLAYIGSEILGGKAQQAFLKAKTKEIEELEQKYKNGGDLQRGIIEAKLKEEKDKLSFVKKRKTWMMAITAVYTAAAVMAALEWACVTGVYTTATCTNWINAGCSGGGLAQGQLMTYAIVGAYSFATGAAGGGGIATLGTLLAGAVAATTASSSVTIGTPIARTITFGASAALAMAVTAGLNSTASDLEKNITKLEKLIADFKTKTHDEEGMGEGAEETDYNDDSKRKYELKALPKGQEIAKHCWGNTAKGLNFSEGTCKNSIKLNRPDFKFGMALPTLTSVGNSAMDMGQAVSDGDMGKADIEAGKLAANALRLKEIKDNIQKQINEQRKAKGEKPIDFQAEENKRIASMMSDMSKRAGVANPGLASIDAKATLDPETTAETSTAAGPVGEEKTASAPAAAPTIDFTFDEGLPAEDLLTEEPTATLTESLEDYETNESDISKKSEVSIFKQLSNRYLLNYTKIFEKKKTVEETPPR